jgi:hypothetical protein
MLIILGVAAAVVLAIAVTVAWLFGRWGSDAREEHARAEGETYGRRLAYIELTGKPPGRVRPGRGHLDAEQPTELFPPPEADTGPEVDLLAALVTSHKIASAFSAPVGRLVEHELLAWPPTDERIWPPSAPRLMPADGETTFIGALRVAPLDKVGGVFNRGLGRFTRKGWRPLYS